MDKRTTEQRIAEANSTSTINKYTGKKVAMTTIHHTGGKTFTMPKTSDFNDSWEKMYNALDWDSKVVLEALNTYLKEEGYTDKEIEEFCIDAINYGMLEYIYESTL